MPPLDIRRAPRRFSPRRWIAISAVPLVLAAGALASTHVVDASAASGVDQCNGGDGAGSVVNCDVTIVNTLNGTTTSSTVTVARHCAGTNVNCVDTTGTTTSSTQLVTAVNQCNNSGNGGGSTMTCHVRITNNIYGSSAGAPTAATVDQCVGSGADGTEPTLACSPYPANTTNATVTQCNGSVNGGGASQRVRCSVSSDATVSAALPVTVNQCNGSDNGGGSVVTCDVEITNNMLTASPSGGTTTSSGTTTSGSAAGGGITGGTTTGGHATRGGGTVTSGRTTPGGGTSTGSQPPVTGPPTTGGAPLAGTALPWGLALLASAGGAMRGLAAGVRGSAHRASARPGR